MNQQALSGLRKLQHSTIQQIAGATDVSTTTTAAAAAAEMGSWLRGLSGAELAGLQGVLAEEAWRRAGAEIL
jgi:hypothetical protein